MAEYAVVITYQLEGEKQKSLLLDTVNDVQVNGRSTLTTMPLVNGDQVSDHMFRNPSTMTISGTCSLNGSKIMVIDGEGSKLANFEELIDKIRKQGVKCNIVKVSVDEDKNIRFLQRSNMVLNNSTVTEKINSLDFTLNFTQILTSEIITLDVDEDDKFLPYVTQPKTLSFANDGLDKNKIMEGVIDILRQEGLITENFLKVIASANWGRIAAGAGVLVGAGVVAAIAAFTGVCASNPVGWVVFAIATTVVGLGFIISSIVKAVQDAKKRNKYIIEIFDWHEGEDAQNEQTEERFLDFMNEIYNELNNLDTLFHLYAITSNEPQEVMLSIDDDYYIFTFTQNNEDESWKVEVLKNNDEDCQIDVGTNENITSSALVSLDALTSSNYLFKTEQARRVYVINNSEDKTDLTGYRILVCDVNPEEITKKINYIIKSHIFRNVNE